MFLQFIASRWLSYSWLLLMTVLFLLPGSVFRGANWLDRIHFDKLVHVGLFSVLVLLWCAAFAGAQIKNALLLLASAVAYGLLIECVQGAWVANRSFDGVDLAADIAGSVLGLAVWYRYKKNKPL